ncbi:MULTISPECIES: helix-turn-helix domain-containing protein [Mesorhizobium]|uniref:helix-turn-helix domain-containing protein n=1 Tax=Mesorhizobium TaxID=68287 RepID=UPI000A6BA5B3|nr:MULTISPECIES: helix-turn-helix domain-containing protein [Mesorhizobium]
MKRAAFDGEQPAGDAVGQRARKPSELLAAQARTAFRHRARHRADGGLPGAQGASSKSLLEGSDPQIGDIAYRRGFTDAGHFSRVLRQQTGITPTHLRHPNRMPACAAG